MNTDDTIVDTTVVPEETTPETEAEVVTEPTEAEVTPAE